MARKIRGGAIARAGEVRIMRNCIREMGRKTRAGCWPDGIFDPQAVEGNGCILAGGGTPLIRPGLGLPWSLPRHRARVI